MLEAQRYKDTWQVAQRERVESGVAENAFVYAHLRADDDKPFYVGIGYVPSRPWQIYNRTKWHKNVAEKHGVRVSIIAESLTWEQAIFWEVRWIKALRAVGYELVNLTDGGDGAKGYTHTPENKQQMAKIARERVLADDYVHPLNLPGVREKHLKATQSEKFKNKQRDRFLKEGNIINRPGARETHLKITQSKDWANKQRLRLLDKNPMFDETSRKKYNAVISSSEYKLKRLLSAPRGLDHYSKKSEEAIAAQKLVGKRLSSSQTKEQRAENGKKGWVKRFRRYQYWGA